MVLLQVIEQMGREIANKRKRRRRRAETFLGLYNRYSNEFVGRLVDMSSIGLKLKSSVECEKQSVFHLRMDLPFEINGSAEIIFNAKRVWQKKDDASNSVYTGFQIQDISKEDLERIKTVLQGALFESKEQESIVTVCKPG